MMRNQVPSYLSLLDRFLDGHLDVRTLQSEYFSAFKAEKTLDEDAFLILDELFGDLDAYTEDPDLLREAPGFYLNEVMLRKRATEARDRLKALISN